jgi:hypothetical protein
MRPLARLRAWRARRANDKAGRATSGRMTQGGRDRAFRERRRP